MEVRPYVGIGTIKFGLTENEIIAQLGEPSNRELMEFDQSDLQEAQLLLKYEDLGLELSFWADTGFRLGIMEFTDHKYTLFGNSYVGKKESFLYQESVKRTLPDLVLDDDFVELGAKDFRSEEYGVSFWLDNNIITSFTIFSEYDESGNNIIWPD